jgi:endonuclease/exonuclease/phosphatase family metal-dependent hydrolase
VRRKPVVRFVSHRTIETHSDHRALWVKVEVRGVELDLISWNVGPGKAADLEHLLTVAGPRGIVALQEATPSGTRVDWHAIAAKYGYQVVDGDGRKGQSATPLLVGPEVEIKAKLRRLLLDRTLVGRGAGPSHNKPKWWIGGRLRLDGVTFGVSSFHELASLQNPNRFRPGTQLARALAKATLHRLVPWFVLGDLNGTPRSRIMRYLRRLGFTSNHLELGELPTHTNRAIDVALIARRWLKPRRTR